MKINISIATICCSSLIAIETGTFRGLAQLELGAIASSNVSQPEKETLSAPQVGKIGKSIVVRIESDRSQGSGVIIKADRDQYTVLTAFHVISHPSQYRIITPDRQTYNLDSITIERIRDLDLATLEFTSSRKYPIAQMGNSDSYSEGTTIYVAGFSAKTSTVRSIYRSVDGKISAIDREDPSEGYGLIYTNNTLDGMSGGAVLNDKGELIGIHGRAETKAQSSFLGSEQISIVIGTGFNLGIPIDALTKVDAIATNSQVLPEAEFSPSPQVEDVGIRPKEPITARNRQRNSNNINNKPSPTLTTSSPPPQPVVASRTTKFICQVKQDIPGVYARSNRGTVLLIKFSKHPDREKCISIAQKFQNSYEKGNLRFLKSVNLANKSYICAVKSKDEICTEENILFEVPNDKEPDRILSKLVNNRGIASVIEL